MNSVLLQWGTSNVLWDSHDQCQTKIILVRGNLFVHTHTQFMNPMNLVISASATDCTSLCSSVSGNSRQVINLKKIKWRTWDLVPEKPRNTHNMVSCTQLWWMKRIHICSLPKSINALTKEKIPFQYSENSSYSSLTFSYLFFSSSERRM